MKCLEQIERNALHRKQYRIRRRKELHEYWNTYKLEKGCCRCGYNKCARALIFHHKNPVTKIMAICRMIQATTGTQRIKDEVAKCDLLCANCHAEEHTE